MLRLSLVVVAAYTELTIPSTDQGAAVSHSAVLALK